MFKKIAVYFKFHLWVKPRIPKGDYCYKILGNEIKDGMPVTRIKRCPYWELRIVDGFEKEDGYCTLLDLSDVLIWDQCKQCGVKIGDED